MVLSSCSNNSDIKSAAKFAESSNILKRMNTEVADDIYNSCSRKSIWQARDTISFNVKDSVKLCDTDYRPNSERAKIAGRLLIDYIAAIGALATEDSNAVKMQFEEIGAALKTVKVQTTDTSTVKISDNTIDTGIRIANFLTNLFLSDFRRENLKVAIVCTDKDIQSYSTDLAEFVEKNYVKSQLDEEIDQAIAYSTGYKSLLNDKTDLLLNSGTPEVFVLLQNTQLGRDKLLQSELEKIISKKNMGQCM